MGREGEWERERRTGPVYSAGGGWEEFVSVPEEGGGVGEVAVGGVWLALEDEKGCSVSTVVDEDRHEWHACSFVLGRY